MKKLFLAVLIISIIYNSVSAQPWADDITKRRVKLNEIDERMKATLPQVSNERDEEEHENYHYSRWKWYWEHHTDKDGYLVSPMYRFNEWLKTYYTNKQNKTTGNSPAWTFRGPYKSPGGYNGIGRINVVAFHPTDTNSFWIGSAGGGTWKTTNGGQSWTSLGDQFPVMGVSDIAFNQLNPNTVYLATGDKEANDTYTIGLLKSTNNGISWDTTGLKWSITDFRQIAGVLVNPLDTNTLTVASTAGIYKSHNGGISFIQTQGGFFKQIIYHPNDTNILFATGYTSGTHQVFRSADGGYTWTQQTNFPGNTRVAIAVTPANPAIVKAVVSNAAFGLEGIYNSKDTGKTFVQIYTATGSGCNGNILASAPSGNACGGQGWYDLTIAINPIDEKNVVVGGVNTWYSADSGKTWQIANQWQSTLPGIKVVHADKHYHAYHPINKQVLFECNDGGIYKTTNPVSSLWTDLTNGLGITQFYRNAVSNISPFVVGGSQDNGSKKLQDTVFSELTGGDGMDCQLDPTDNNTFYTSIQYGELRRTTNGGGNFTDISNNITGNPKGDWITPFILHPFDNSIILAAYAKVYLSENKGTTWKEISPSFGSNAKRIAMSPNSQENIFVVVDNQVRYTTNFGQNWQLIIGKPAGTISDIAIDPKNGDRFFVTQSGYGTEKVFEYTLGGSWNAISQNLPDIPLYCIAIDSADGTLYVGTDFGVYYRTTTMNQWEPYNTGLANVEVTDLGINYTTNEIWASTYGRGMWKSVRYGYPVGIMNAIPYAADAMQIYPNPNKGAYTLQVNNNLSGKSATLQLVSVTGQVVMQQQVQIPANGKLQLATDLPSGTYMAQLVSDNMVKAKCKMIKY
ncbi:hypothetical protein CAP35_00535 [Chitinophagaceae bacterium IBVUCB1]|nr:hypothetical protein CAP35_00535 [Chitinophagaceae bacterium IBVUCB1]